MTVGQRALGGPPALPINTTDSIGKLLSIFVTRARAQTMAPPPAPAPGTNKDGCEHFSWRRTRRRVGVCSTSWPGWASHARNWKLRTTLSG